MNAPTSLKSHSIRTRLLLLVAGTTAVVAIASTIYFALSSSALLRDQVVKRGLYIASNLAYNSKYGVLTEDKPLLSELLEGAMAAAGSEGSDVVGALVRDARGTVLAARGKPVADLAAEPARTLEEVDAVTEDGEPVLLFRAPVTMSAAPAAGMAAELGLAAPTAPATPEQKGGVEVAISRRGLDAQQRRTLLVTTLTGLLLFGLASVAGWFVLGRWFEPLQNMVDVAQAVAKGDLTRSLEKARGDEIGDLGGSLKTRWSATCAASWTTSRRPPSRWPPRPARSPPTPGSSPRAPRPRRRPPRRPPPRWSRWRPRSRPSPPTPRAWRRTSRRPRARSAR